MGGRSWENQRVDMIHCQCSNADWLVFLASAVTWGLFFGLSFYKAIDIRNDIKNREDVNTLRHLSTSKVLVQFMSNTNAGIIYDCLVGTLSVASTALFIWDTYNPEDAHPAIDGGNSTSTRHLLAYADDEEQAETGWVLQAELIIANFFIMNWLVTLYVTPARIGYLFGYESIIDITTCIPVYLSICRAAQDVDTGILRTTRVYRLTRILRVFRMLRPVTLVARDAFSNPIKAHLFKIVSWFTITLLIISGVVQVAAKYDQEEWGFFWNINGEELTLHESFYFVIVTMSTVGYGDIAPSSDISKVLVSTLLMAFMVMVPLKVSEFSDFLRMNTRAASNTLSAKYAGHHVIISCEITAQASVESMVSEIFHEDRGISAKYISHVVVMLTGEPTFHWKSLAFRWPRRLTILRGNVLIQKDLARARAEQAAGIFIVADPYAEDILREEKIVLRRAIAIRNFLTYFGNHQSIFVQTITKEYWQRLVHLGFDGHNITCYEELRRCLGISTIIQNALATSSQPSLPHDVEWPEWYKSYCPSVGVEFYKLPIGRLFGGESLREIVRFLYREYGIILMCVCESQAGLDRSQKGETEDAMDGGEGGNVGRARSDSTDVNGPSPRGASKRGNNDTGRFFGLQKKPGSYHGSWNGNVDSDASSSDDLAAANEGGVSGQASSPHAMQAARRRSFHGLVSARRLSGLRSPSDGLSGGEASDPITLSTYWASLVVDDREDGGLVEAHYFGLALAPDWTVISQICSTGPYRFEAFKAERRAMEAASTMASGRNHSESSSSMRRVQNRAPAFERLYDFSNDGDDEVYPGYGLDEGSEGRDSDTRTNQTAGSGRGVAVSRRMLPAKANRDGQIVIICNSLHGLPFIVSVLRRSERRARFVTIICGFNSGSQETDAETMREMREVFRAEAGSEEPEPFRFLTGINTMNYKEARLDLAHTVVLLSGRGDIRDHAANFDDIQHRDLASSVEGQEATMAQLVDDNTMSVCIDALQYVDPLKTRVVVELNGNDHIYQYEIIRANSTPEKIRAFRSATLASPQGDPGGGGRERPERLERQESYPPKARRSFNGADFSEFMPNFHNLRLPSAFANGRERDSLGGTDAAMHAEGRVRGDGGTQAAGFSAPFLKQNSLPTTPSAARDGRSSGTASSPWRRRNSSDASDRNATAANAWNFGRLSDVFNRSIDRPHNIPTLSVPPVEDHRLHASYASGDVVLSTFSESFLASLYFTPEISAFLQLFFGAIDNDVCKDERQTMVKCVPWDELCAQKLVSLTPTTFGDLLDDLLDMDIMPFGILRTDVHTSENHRFTMAVPAPDLEVFPTDCVYCMYKMKCANDARGSPTHSFNTGRGSTSTSKRGVFSRDKDREMDTGGAGGAVSEVELPQMSSASRGRPKQRNNGTRGTSPTPGPSGIARRPQAKTSIRRPEQRGHSAPAETRL